MMKRGSFKTPRPMLLIPIWTLRWAFFWEGNLLISCFIASLVLRHCHFVVVCFSWNFGHCMVDHVVILALGTFWIIEFFGMVQLEQCWWVMNFGNVPHVVLLDEFRLEFWGHWSYGNLLCRLVWTSSSLMNAEILLGCVSLVSWV